MVGREKSKRALAKGLSQDRISQLPDHLLCHILSHIPTKEVVTTSVLSTRWRSLWLWVSSLELNTRNFSDFNAFVRFGDRFLDSDRVSCIQKLTLTLGKVASKAEDESYFTSWIDAAIKRKIEHLNIRWSMDVYLDENPLRLYSCETLVYLRLFGVILDDAVFVVLPCLKKLYLEQNLYSSEATFEKLISSCPVLENLKIVAFYNDGKFYRVRSRSLKRLNIVRRHLVVRDCVPGVVIDAPLLRRLTIDDHESKSFIVNNLEPNAKLNIPYIDFSLEELYVESRVSSRRGSICDFLSGLLRVGNMTMSRVAFKLIFRYSELEPLPQFGCMSRLRVSLYASNLKWLERFLHSCPNLKDLVIVEPVDNYHYKLYAKKMNQISSPSVPECLSSSLEFVDFKLSIWRHDGEEVKLVKYFLENSAILKKLTLRLGNHPKKDEIVKKVIEIPRSSTKCEVIML